VGRARTTVVAPAALRATAVRTVATAEVIPAAEAEAEGTSEVAVVVATRVGVAAADTPAAVVVDTPEAEAVIARAEAAHSGAPRRAHEIEARQVDVYEVKVVRGGKGGLNGPPFLTAKVSEFQSFDVSKSRQGCLP